MNPTSTAIKTHQTPTSSHVSVSVTTSTGTDSQTLINMLCQSPPTCLFIRMELCREETLRDLLAKSNKECTRKKKDMFDYFDQVI